MAIRCYEHNGLVTDGEIICMPYVDEFGYPCFNYVCKDCVEYPTDENDEREYRETVMPEFYFNGGEVENGQGSEAA